MAGPDIWRSCHGPRHVRARSFEAWRVVEGQHVISTRKLVDTLEEQEILESLIERAKPSAALFARLHYLLFTPFRYPPLRHGSRFAVRTERSLWYGARDRRAALAERAYYRLLFLEGTSAALAPLTTEETAFRASIRAARFVDLGAGPFRAHESRISSRTSYAHAQPLGAAMRAAGVQAFAYVSARDKERGTNCALFEPVFAKSDPLESQTWICTAAPEAVDFRSRFLGRSHVFPREDFTVAGVLPAPGV